MDPEIDLIIEKLTAVGDDRTSGSTRLLEDILDILVCNLSIDGNYVITQIIRLADSLNTYYQRHRYFGVIGHFTGYFLQMVKALQHKDINGKDLISGIQNYRKQWEDVNGRIAINAAGKIDFSGKRVLLHSHSGTVIALMEYLSGKGIDLMVVQTESRPLMEGRIQAAKLAKLGFPVRVIVDADLTRITGDIDMAVTGADLIGPDFFVNKIGTYAIARQCHELSVPFYMLCDSRKTTTEHWNDNILDGAQPEEEVWQGSPDLIVPENFYFEPIPRDLVTEIIDEV